MDTPSPEQIEDAKAKGRMVAGLVHEHFLALKDSGFDEEEAFELASNYHWALLVGDKEEYE
jgi:hypothetical protein